MTYANQIQHDEINVASLVRRLEKSISNQSEWDTSVQSNLTWLKAQGALQKVRFAKKLMKNVELHDVEPTPTKASSRNEMKTTLEKIEAFLSDIEKRTAVTPIRPSSILSRIPIPLAEPEPEPVQVQPDVETVPDDESAGLSNQPLVPTDNLLLSPTETSPSSSTGLISSIPIQQSTSTSISTALSQPTSQATPRRNMHASSALQDELTSQLAQMSAQLKRNAIYFSDSLEKDKSVIEDAQQKIEGNFGFMQTQRLRLRDHRGKSWGTTGLTVAIVLVVVLIFLMMVSVIRFS